MREERPKAFGGGMNARKYMNLTKASKATVARHPQYLAVLNAFIATGGGKSTSYQINCSIK